MRICPSHRAIPSLLRLIVLLLLLLLLVVVVLGLAVVGVELGQHLMGVRVDALAVVLCNIVCSYGSTFRHNRFSTVVSGYSDTLRIGKRVTKTQCHSTHRGSKRMSVQQIVTLTAVTTIMAIL